MRVIVDTDGALNVLLESKLFAEAAVTVFYPAEWFHIDAFLCATMIITIDYLLIQSLSVFKARGALCRLISRF